MQEPSNSPIDHARPGWVEILNKSWIFSPSYKLLRALGNFWKQSDSSNVSEKQDVITMQKQKENKIEVFPWNCKRNIDRIWFSESEGILDKEHVRMNFVVSAVSMESFSWSNHQ